MAAKHLRKFLEAAFTQFWQRLVTAPRRTGRYRPERHYMRGPGPKSLGRKRLEIATGDKG
jgi:hypothetical protein